MYRVTHQVVPKLSIQGLCNSHTGPESRVWEQLDVTPCTYFEDFVVHFAIGPIKLPLK